jgi:adenylate cyclase, class 2
MKNKVFYLKEFLICTLTDVAQSFHYRIMHINIEFKAKAANIILLEEKLKILSPVFIGIDHQIDTYFNIPKGRLKLREGSIESSLIYYERADTAGSKQSDVLLYEHTQNATLKQLLTKVHGIKAVVDKQRKIYFVDNVKFHFDTVKDLGTFIEVEAIAKNEERTVAQLQEQCNYYANFFAVQQQDYISISYSDMVI